MQAKIFPPAWRDTWIIYGGTPWNATCPDSLCVFDIWGNSHWQLDPDILEGSDMPVRGDNWLFYRYTDVDGSRLRAIEDFDWQSCNPGPCDFVKPFQAHPATACPGDPGNDATDPRPNFVHTDVVFDSDDTATCNYVPVDYDLSGTGPTYDMEYFDVSPYGRNIMFYGNENDGFRNVNYRWDLEIENTTVGVGPCADGVGTDSDRCFPEWDRVTWDYNNTHFVDSMVGNFWHGYPWEYTLYWAERDAVDWVP
jgi:hypothetical protein